MTVNTSKKEKVTNDLYYFYRYFIASHYSNSVPAPHIHKLANKLMQLYRGKSKPRLAVSMPPSALKIKYGNFGVSVMVDFSESEFKDTCC